MRTHVAILAAASALPLMFGRGTRILFDPAPAGEGGGAGGSGATPPANGSQTPPAGGATQPPAKEPEKLTLTQAELDAKVAAAVKAKQDEIDAANKTAKEEADRKAAEAAGKHKELYDSEKLKREAAETELQKSRAEIALRDVLAEKFPDYTTCAKYILPMVDISKIAPDKLAAELEKAATAYAKDNPRAKGTGTPQAPTRRGTASAPAGGTGGNANPPTRFTGAVTSL